LKAECVLNAEREFDAARGFNAEVRIQRGMRTTVERGFRDVRSADVWMTLPDLIERSIRNPHSAIRSIRIPHSGVRN